MVSEEEPNLRLSTSFFGFCKLMELVFRPNQVFLLCQVSNPVSFDQVNGSEWRSRWCKLGPGRAEEVAQSPMVPRLQFCLVLDPSLRSIEV